MKRALDLRRLSWGLCLAIGACAAWPAQAQRVIVVASAATEPYQQALDGVTQLDVSVERFRLVPEQEGAIVAAIRRGGRDTAVIALGGAAALVVAHARSAPNSGPIVNCMVVDAASAHAPTRASAVIDVPLAVPASTEAASIRRLLPQARTAGILYDPARSEARAAESAVAMANEGFATIREAVPIPAALPVALQRMQDHADLLYALPDTTVYAREHARALLLFSFRHRIPLVGPTESWVKAGALFAIDWDYVDLGRYCGVLALQQLAGARTSPRPPRIRIVANRHTARQLRIEWDAEQLRLIDRMYP
ncbi:MAG: hypothetical protein IT522_10910 [Burkholderiales bacterium]|nr:hypothetical protein [Burkholderiales bacterium]